MKHPVTTRRENIFYYLVVWMALAVIHIILVEKYTFMPLNVAIVDGLLSQLMMGVIGLGMWYLVRYSDPNLLKRVRLFINLLLGGALVVFIWLMMTYGLLRFIYRFLPDVQSYLADSLLIRYTTGFVLYLMLIAYYYLVNYYRLIGERVEAEAMLQQNVKESELAYLRAQINPHFLFNALNSVSSLIRSNPLKAQETVVELSHYLRQIMQMSKRRFVTVEEEMLHISQLLDIEQVRYSDRLTKSIHISESCNQKEIPSLILQPIFENALKFGLHESTGPATIKGDVWCDEVFLYVNISNNYEKEAHTAKGTGKGLKNVKQRLDLIYGKMYRMHISDDGSNFEVRLSIPVKVEF